MNRLKTVITLLIIISMSLSISSCSATASATDITATTSQVDPTFTDNDHLTIIDMSGREVIFDKKIERVIAIGSALRLYTYVNGVDMLVGVEKAQQDPATGRPYIMANPELQNCRLSAKVILIVLIRNCS
jgi:iron complex transport system substrate-binding protein